MDITHLLAGTAKAPPIGKPAAASTEPGVQFASILEDAANIHGTPKGLTLLATSARADADVKGAADQALRMKPGPADLPASKEAGTEGKLAPQADPEGAQKPVDKGAQKAGKKTDADHKSKRAAGADAEHPNTPISAAIDAALAAV